MIAFLNTLKLKSPTSGRVLTLAALLLSLPLSASATETVLYSFGAAANDGANSQSPLIQGLDGNFYGVTYYGGTAGDGTLFEYNPTTQFETVLHNFGDGSVANDGILPLGPLIQATDGNFYGTCSDGGNVPDDGFEHGTIFEYNPTTQVETVVHNFGGSGDGRQPVSGVIQAKDGNFYGTTPYNGGSVGPGTIFEYNTTTQTEAVVHDFGFDSNGYYANSALFQASNGNFYSETYHGGDTTYGGTLYEYDPLTQDVTALHDFAEVNVANNGESPEFESLIQGSDGNLYSTTLTGGEWGNGVLYRMNLLDDTLSVLHSFGSSSDGIYPYGALVQDPGGFFYGTTGEGGGSADNGTAFEYSPSSHMTLVLHSFGDGTVANDGANPLAGLIRGSDGNFYGTTEYGGKYGNGAIFELTPPFTNSDDQPSLTSLSPGNAPVGSQPSITITGQYFDPGCMVLVNGTGYGVQWNSSTSLSFVMPATKMDKAHVLQVQVQNPNGYISNALPFTVDNPPVITSLSSYGALIGPQPTITITGENFVSGCSVLCNVAYAGTSNSYRVDFVNSTTLSFTIPSTEMAVPHLLNLQVQNPDGSISNVKTFMVSDDQPYIIALWSNSAPVGPQPTIEIYGWGFDEDCTVLVNGTPYAISNWIRPLYVSFVMPSTKMDKAHVLQVQVENPNGYISNAVPFTVYNPPTITSLSPSSAPVGPQPVITITGANFFAGSTVVVNGDSYQAEFVNSTTLSFTMPSSKMDKAHTLAVQVEDPNGGISNSAPFTVTQ